jgi:biopolymer transport protein ExbD
MAELNTGGGGGKGGKVRSKKSNPGVDLTAMVDLAFLLITFFILTTTLSKPQAMDLNVPDNTKVPDVVVPETPGWRTITVVLGKEDKMLYYVGMPGSFYAVGSQQDNSGKPELVKIGKDGIRKIILEQKQFVLDNVTNPKTEGLSVLIKASKTASYNSLVDILDEMSITKPFYYGLVDITPEDIKMLQDKGIK